ncbi:MAG: RNA degradosome polyphosphate kinase [Actinobacteria bacterium]|nr:RNA degradosome polyphosphate kinase [Actinomycetota bacterium]
MADSTFMRYIERESSWLAFNERVFELAKSPDSPLLERAKFLAIFASNLDEFFMVRVATLKRRIATGLALKGPTGEQPKEVLASVLAQVKSMVTDHAEFFRDDVAPKLLDEGIEIVDWEKLTTEEREYLDTLFTNRVFPVLTPLSVDPSHPFPYISGLSLNLAILVKNPENGEDVFARVKVPPLMPRFVETLPRGTGRFLPLESLIAEHLADLFPGMEIIAHHSFRVTRNQDLEVEEDDSENLLHSLEQELLRRRFGPAVRLEVSRDIDKRILDRLSEELGVEANEIFHLPEPLDLTGLFSIAGLDRPELKFSPFSSRTHPSLVEVDTDSVTGEIFEAIKRKEILLHHPFDSFTSSVVSFLEQAAADPKVLAIKQTLYRTSGDSPIVDALIDAASAGKQVLALVELRARFDELANVRWARKLEEAGVHVVYGVLGLKTHAKLSLVVRDEGDQLMRYCHIGTGNYNPKTARQYEDLGILTADPELCDDLSRLFNQLSGMAPQTDFRRLLVAPRTLRPGLIERIKREIAHAEAGKPAGIRMKLNSLEDENIIDALYKASEAGIKVEIIVRGICALRAGVPGLSENITVRSYLGRFLEHSRIFHFHNAGHDELWIGSADMMHRNLDRRVETLVRIVAPNSHQKLMVLLDELTSGKFAAWFLQESNEWVRQTQNSIGEDLQDLQEFLIARSKASQ